MTIAETIAASLEALRGIDPNAPTSLAYARIQHFVGTQGNSTAIRAQLAIIKDPASTEAQRLAAVAAIERPIDPNIVGDQGGLLTKRDTRDTTLRDRVLAVDTAWQTLNAQVAPLADPVQLDPPLGWKNYTDGGIQLMTYGFTGPDLVALESFLASQGWQPSP